MKKLIALLSLAGMAWYLNRHRSQMDSIIGPLPSPSTPPAPAPPPPPLDVDVTDGSNPPKPIDPNPPLVVDTADDEPIIIDYPNGGQGDQPIIAAGIPLPSPVPLPPAPDPIPLPPNDPLYVDPVDGPVTPTPPVAPPNNDPLHVDPLD